MNLPELANTLSRACSKVGVTINRKPELAISLAAALALGAATWSAFNRAATARPMSVATAQQIQDAKHTGYLQNIFMIFTFKDNQGDTVLFAYNPRFIDGEMSALISLPSKPQVFDNAVAFNTAFNETRHDMSKNLNGIIFISKQVNLISDRLSLFQKETISSVSGINYNENGKPQIVRSVSEVDYLSQKFCARTPEQMIDVMRYGLDLWQANLDFLEKNPAAQKTVTVYIFSQSSDVDGLILSDDKFLAERNPDGASPRVETGMDAFREFKAWGEALRQAARCIPKEEHLTANPSAPQGP